MRFRLFPQKSSDRPLGAVLNIRGSVVPTNTVVYALAAAICSRCGAAPQALFRITSEWRIAAKDQSACAARRQASASRLSKDRRARSAASARYTGANLSAPLPELDAARPE
jgi:hypothetical protein